MRHKIPDDKKRKKLSITINEDLEAILKKYMETNDIKNVSSYIEHILIKNLEEKGIEIKKTF